MSSDGAAIAEALRRDPVYVDPAYEGALPKARRASLTRRVRASHTPIYVLLVPIVASGTWQTSEQLATVVQAHLGRDGAYVTFDPDFGNGFGVVMWGGTEEEQESAREAGWVVALENPKASLAARLARCVDLIATGRGTEAYEKAQRTAFPSHPASPLPKRAVHHGGHGLAVGGGAAAVVLLGGGLYWLRRRRARAAMEALELPRTVFGTAREAEDDELRARAERDLIALSEDLPADEHALDAYTAAGRTLDGARSTADLAGVLALIQTARGGRHLCYFDPRHGEGTIAVAWRAPGTRPRLDVRACATCAKAVRDRRAPDVVLDRGRPYYEAATPWADTGYGQFGDLVERILGE